MGVVKGRSNTDIYFDKCRFIPPILQAARRTELRYKNIYKHQPSSSSSLPTPLGRLFAASTILKRAEPEPGIRSRESIACRESFILVVLIVNGIPLRTEILASGRLSKYLQRCEFLVQSPRDLIAIASATNHCSCSSAAAAAVLIVNL